MPFSVVAALVQLGHKYRIQPVLNEGIRRMSSCFSDKLDVWDAANKSMGSALMSYASTDAIAVVNTARLTGVDSMLPVALYLCCQLDIDTILNGVPRADGSRVRLNPDDVALCLERRGSLCHDNVVSALRIWRPTPSEKCEKRGCVRVLEAVNRDWLDYDNSSLNHVAAMDSWDEFFENGEFELCEPCLEMVKERAIEERRTMWERLPRLFGVSPASQSASVKRDSSCSGCCISSVMPIHLTQRFRYRNSVICLPMECFLVYMVSWRNHLLYGSYSLCYCRMRRREFCRRSGSCIVSWILELSRGF